MPRIRRGLRDRHEARSDDPRARLERTDGLAGAEVDRIASLECGVDIEVDTDGAGRGHLSALEQAETAASVWPIDVEAIGAVRPRGDAIAGRDGTGDAGCDRVLGPGAGVNRAEAVLTPESDPASAQEMTAVTT